MTNGSTIIAILNASNPVEVLEVCQSRWVEGYEFRGLLPEWAGDPVPLAPPLRHAVFQRPRPVPPSPKVHCGGLL